MVLSWSVLRAHDHHPSSPLCPSFHENLFLCFTKLLQETLEEERRDTTYETYVQDASHKMSIVRSLVHSPERSPRSASAPRSSTPSPNGSQSDLSAITDQTRPPVILGVCAMDVKARSKAMREILTRLVERSNGAIEVKVFGDKVILDEGASSLGHSPLRTR